MEKPQGMARYFNNTDMRLRWKYVEVASRYIEMEFKLTGKEGEEMIGGVELFTYLGRPLDQSDDKCPEIRRNIR